MVKFKWVLLDRESCALKGAFLWIGGEKIWCAKPWSVCALTDFCLTLTYRDATKIHQEPCAVKVMVRFGVGRKIIPRDLIWGLAAHSYFGATCHIMNPHNFRYPLPFNWKNETFSNYLYSDQNMTKMFYLCFTQSIKKASQFPERLDFPSSGNRTRTCDLRVMSPTSYLLLYPAMYFWWMSRIILIFSGLPN